MDSSLGLNLFTVLFLSGTFLAALVQKSNSRQSGARSACFSKHYEEIINWLTWDGFLPEDLAIALILEMVSDEPQTGNNETLEPARQQPATGGSFEPARVQIASANRDEHEALEAATSDLVRLDRYERRTWSGLKRAIREFINIKTMTRFSSSAT